MKKKTKKPAILRVRKKSMTDRGNLSTKVIDDKKKKTNKRKCRGKVDTNDC